MPYELPPAEPVDWTGVSTMPKITVASICPLTHPADPASNRRHLESWARKAAAAHAVLPTDKPGRRPFWPAFDARSRRDPSAVEDDYGDWCRRWDDALRTSQGVAWHRTVPIEKRISEGSPFSATRGAKRRL